MRNIVIAASIAAAAFSSPVLAAANSGPYVGVGITHDNISSGGDLEGLGMNGIGGTAFAGFKVPFATNAYAALEANFDLMSAKVGDGLDSVKADHAYGVSYLLGYNLNDSTALYGRAGYQRGKETTRIDGVSYSASRNGLRLGAGLETKVNETIGLRAEYNRTHYYLSNADKDAIAPLKSGVNNDQFVFAVVYGF